MLLLAASAYTRALRGLPKVDERLGCKGDDLMLAASPLLMWHHCLHAGLLDTAELLPWQCLPCYSWLPAPALTTLSQRQ